MKRHPLFILCCICCCTVKSQSLPGSITNGYAALTTYSSTQADAFSFFSNQAALVPVKLFSAGLYAERPYFLTGINYVSAVMLIVAGQSRFGWNAVYLGSEAYHEYASGLAYARSLGKIDVGIQFNYHAIGIAGYGSLSTANVEAGMILHVVPGLQAGMHLSNPYSFNISASSKERTPVIYTAGFGYDVSGSCFFGAALIKKEGDPVSVDGGIQYQFSKKLFVRIGIRSAQPEYYFGTGFTWQGWRIDVSAAVHPQLGITPGMLFLYKNKQDQ